MTDDGESEREISTCGAAGRPGRGRSVGCKISDSRKIPDPHQPDRDFGGARTQRVEHKRSEVPKHRCFLDESVSATPTSRRPPPSFHETRGQSDDAEEP